MNEKSREREPLNKTVIFIVVGVLIAIGIFKVWDRWMFYREFHDFRSKVDADFAQPFPDEIDMPPPPPPPPASGP